MAELSVLLGQYNVAGIGSHLPVDPDVDVPIGPNGGLLKGLAPTVVVGSAQAGHKKEDCHYLHDDGVFDGIAAAIAAANALGGGTVYLKKGTYVIPASTYYEIDDYVSIVGEEANGTILDFSLSGDVSYLLDVTGDKHHFKDFCVKFPDTPGPGLTYGIYLNYGDDTVIENLRYLTPGSTTNVRAFIGGYYSYKLSISLCREAYASPWAARCPFLELEGSSNFELFENDVYHHSDVVENHTYSIKLLDCFDGTIRDNILSMRGGTPGFSYRGAIYVAGQYSGANENLKFIDNTIYTSANGITFDTFSAFNPTMLNNAVRGNHIKLYDNNFLAEAIACYDTGLTGVKTSFEILSNKVECANDVYASWTTGIFCDPYCFDFIIKGNILNMADRNAIGIYFQSEGFNIEANHIWLLGAHAFMAGIAVNVVNPGDAVSGAIANNRVNCWGETSIGIAVTAAAMVTISGNTVGVFIGLDSHCFDIFDCDYSAIEGNTAVTTSLPNLDVPTGIRCRDCLDVALGDNAVVLLGTPISEGIADSIAWPSSGTAMGNRVANIAGGTPYVFNGAMYYETPVPGVVPLPLNS